MIHVKMLDLRNNTVPGTVRYSTGTVRYLSLTGVRTHLVVLSVIRSILIQGALIVHNSKCYRYGTVL